MCTAVIKNSGILRRYIVFFLRNDQSAVVMETEEVKRKTQVWEVLELQMLCLLRDTLLK